VLYRNRGKALFTDATHLSGTGRNTRFVGWGCGFFDPDNDGWPDIFYCNGHVYPELAQAHLEVNYRQPPVLYRNLGNGRFEDVTGQAGDCLAVAASARGCAFGDLDNDGDTDILINNMNDLPSLFRCDRSNQNHWIKIRLVGVKSNRSGIGARIRCVAGGRTQIDEVRSGGSYFSQNDLRVHFGLGPVKKIDRIEISWPSGKLDALENLSVDRILLVKEGAGYEAK
jgi:hypothetical protein